MRFKQSNKFLDIVNNNDPIKILFNPIEPGLNYFGNEVLY